MKKPKILLQDFVAEDAAGMVSCIFEEYGKSYFLPAFYQKDYLCRLQESAKTHFLVAKCMGEVVAMLALHYRGKSAFLSTGIVKKAYRGLGILGKLFHLAIEKAKEKGLFTLYCRSVAYHDITQRRLEELGFTPTAFLMAEFLTQGQYSYKKDKNLKHPHILLVRHLQGPKTSGKIFLDAAYKNVAASIYQELAISVEIAEVSLPLAAKTHLHTEYDDSQYVTSIFIHRAGADLLECVKKSAASRQNALQTVNVFLNINSVDAVAACKFLCAEGYFFTGFFPLYYEEEYMVFHHAMSLSCDFMSFSLTPKAAKLLSIIETLRGKGASL